MGTGSLDSLNKLGEELMKLKYRSRGNDLVERNPKYIVKEAKDCREESRTFSPRQMTPPEAYWAINKQ